MKIRKRAIQPSLETAPSIGYLELLRNNRRFRMLWLGQVVSQMVDSQAMALATGSIFVTAAIVFAAAASIVWLAPRPKHAVAAGHAH